MEAGGYSWGVGGVERLPEFFPFATRLEINHL